jgi:hypothetical protein
VGDNIEINFGELECGIMDWIGLIQDREQLRVKKNPRVWAKT